MTAQITDVAAQAHAHIADVALTESGTGRVGLELELHLVDLATPARRPAWTEVTDLLAALPALPSGSSVTVEPGGQVELSTPPAPDVCTAIDELAADEQVLRRAAAESGFGLAALGGDPARTPERINPGGRYVAMQQHFDAVGCGAAGLDMMTCTAGLQVNLDSGPRSGWAERVRRLHQLAPILTALSACSPSLGGRSSGWVSMRQQAWMGIDRARTDPFYGPAASDPSQAWASYALAAPVMEILGDGPAYPVLQRIPLSDWPVDVAGRLPSTHDVDFHLTTLFPPIRPRGYLELRCLDAIGSRWWPMLAAVTATLADDVAASDRAAELCDRLPVPSWTVAARDGLRDDRLRLLATGCLRIAGERGPSRFGNDVDEFLALVAGGGSPAADVATRIAEAGAVAVLREEARA